jgi:hypothetical protein
MPISPSLLGIHRIWGEDRVEHVCGVDLRGEVAVVARVVATDEMSEGGLAVAPIAYRLSVTVEGQKYGQLT